MAAGGEGGAAKDEVGGVFRCSETQLADGVAGGCAIHPWSKPPMPIEKFKKDYTMTPSLVQKATRSVDTATRYNPLL